MLIEITFDELRQILARLASQLASVANADSTKEELAAKVQAVNDLADAVSKLT
jgi:hypothetical protein